MSEASSDAPLPRPLPGAPFEARVMGVEVMKIDLEPVEVWDYVELRKEPTNTYDPNAVQVFHPETGGRCIGYLPRNLAARMPDPGEFQAVVSFVFTYEGAKAGVRLMVGRVGKKRLVEAAARAQAEATRRGVTMERSGARRAADDWDDGPYGGGYGG